MKRNLLPRGFKTRAEEISLDIRKKLGLRPTHACPARRVAQLYEVSVTSNAALIETVQLLVSEFPEEHTKQQLQSVYTSDSLFSALMVIIKDFKMILYNERHSPARQESDLMHEMAHIIQQHPGDDLQLGSDIALRGHDDQYEEEAKWLGSVLQIPEVGLMWLAKNGFSKESIAERYGASIEMVDFRWKMCGVGRRLQRLGLS